MSVRVFGVIPAAGRSRRMGRDKQLIDVGGRPMLAVVIEAMLDGGIRDVYVVTRREIFESLPDDVRVDVICVENDDPATEMIDSVRMGMDAACRDGRVDGFAVCPGDIPGLAAGDVRACVDAFRASPERIVIATHDGRRGHPVVIPAGLLEVVKSNACDGGLNSLSRAYADRVAEIACSSTGVLRDVDRPGDLA